MEVSSDNLNWTTLYTILFQQQFNQYDPYLDAVVDLLDIHQRLLISVLVVMVVPSKETWLLMIFMLAHRHHVQPHSLSFVAGKNDATFSFNSNGNTGTFVYEWGRLDLLNQQGLQTAFGFNNLK